MHNLNSSFTTGKRTAYLFLLLFLFSYSCHYKNQNRLSKASSPYLREHADNPVDWYEWGDEALQKAKRENKPLLISVGYSSCHWCHMMEKESFMDTTVARVMNENFVCIKVDREERPDIDNVYSSAAELLSGNSGWPLNAFALPNGNPFFAGTYYSKPAWISLLQQISAAYKTQRNKVNLQAQELSAGIANLEFSVLADSSANLFDKTNYQRFFDSVYKKMDLISGGLKGTPKFPAPSCLEFLLQYYFATKDKSALNAATTTLTKMALGGIYDQVGGGFSRYAIDSSWHIPHFEKMLYDNAQLISVYSHAYQLTQNEFFKQIVQEIISFTDTDLRSPSGGYYSSLNADTRDGEGDFYTWSYNELKKNLSNNYTVAADYYNISEEGNWKENKNILFASDTPDQYAQKNNLQSGLFAKQLAFAKQTLLAERNKREKPSVDDKVLTSWNALMLTGFLDAYAAIGNKTYLENALSIGVFLEKKMIQNDGELYRNYKDGKTTISGFLDDYALLSKAYIKVYQVTFDKHWLTRSKQLTDYAIKKFYDPKSKMFFYTTSQSDNAVIRKIDITDNSLPSSNAVMAEVLYTLGTYFENEDYVTKCRQMLSKIYQQLSTDKANYYAGWSCVAGFFSQGTNEVAIIGNDAIKKSLELQKNYLPFSLFIGSTSDENLPLLEGKKSGTETWIYVCTNKTCKKPVLGTTDALHQLSR